MRFNSSSKEHTLKKFAMNKLSKEKKQQLIMVAVGTLGAIAAIYFLLISAQLGEITKKRMETEDTRQKVEKAENTVKMAEEVDKEVKARAKQLELIEDRMASGDLAQWIPDTVRQIKLPYTNIVAKPTSVESVAVGMFPVFPYSAPVFPYSAIKFVVRGSGYYHELGKFFTDFENTHPYFRIQNLELEPAPLDPGASTNKVQELLAFKADFVVLLKPNPAPPPAPSPKPK